VGKCQTVCGTCPPAFEHLDAANVKKYWTSVDKDPAGAQRLARTGIPCTEFTRAVKCAHTGSLLYNEKYEKLRRIFDSIRNDVNHRQSAWTWIATDADSVANRTGGNWADMQPAITEDLFGSAGASGLWASMPGNLGTKAAYPFPKVPSVGAFGLQPFSPGTYAKLARLEKPENQSGHMKEMTEVIADVAKIRGVKTFSRYTGTALTLNTTAQAESAQKGTWRGIYVWLDDLYLLRHTGPYTTDASDSGRAFQNFKDSDADALIVELIDALEDLLYLLWPWQAEDTTIGGAGLFKAGPGAAMDSGSLDWCTSTIQMVLDGLKEQTDKSLRAMQDNINKLKPAWGAPTPAQQAQIDALEKAMAALRNSISLAGLVGTIFLGKVVKRTFKEQCFLLSHIDLWMAWRNPKKGEDGAATWAAMDGLWYGKREPYVMPVGHKRNAPVQAGQHSIAANACLQVKQEPWGFMNKMTQTPGYRDFFNIENKYLSQLSPRIRLFKVISDKKGIETEVELNFDTHYTGGAFENILQNKSKRGFGVGIKSFDFTYHGSDPFAVKKAIKAKLVIFASTFDELLRVRQGSANERTPRKLNYRYADLALKTGGSFKEQYMRRSGKAEIVAQNLEQLNFRLKAVVGWVPPRHEQAFKGASKDLTTALKNSFVTLNLTPTVHEFGIDDMGRVTFTINYLAYVEEFFDNQNFNIFNDPAIIARAYERKLKFKKAETDCKGAPTGDTTLSDLRRDHAEQISEDKETGLQSIVAKLLESGKIWYVPIPLKDIHKFNRQGPYFDMATVAKPRLTLSTGAATTDALKEQHEIMNRLQNRFQRSRQNNSTLPAGARGDKDLQEYINFIYLSDLVDTILELLDISFDKRINATYPAGADAGFTKNDKAILKRFRDNYKRFRVVLGPVELKTKNDEWKYYSLGDIPVSLAYLMEWLTERVIALDKATYSLSNFLRDLINGLIRNFLNADTCFDTNVKQKTRLYHSVVTGYSSAPGGRDEITALMGSNSVLDTTSFKGKKLPVIKIMGAKDGVIHTRNIKNEHNYMIFYAGRTRPQAAMSGDEGTDAKNGIFHYLIGKDRGIIKNIQLTKTNSPGLQEVRFEMEGYDGLAQLMVVYDAKITCYGSPNILPGTYIYIDPRGFAPNTKKNTHRDSHGKVINNNALTRYGVGGYYMVITAENSFGPGKAETIINAKWVAAIGTEDDEKGTEPDHSATYSAHKCHSA
tara:strand:+ start:13026 stop:16679 length:3654 start_codon:yes stop_codon:yes gene_type:complete